MVDADWLERWPCGMRSILQTILSRWAALLSKMMGIGGSNQTYYRRFFRSVAQDVQLDIATSRSIVRDARRSELQPANGRVWWASGHRGTGARVLKSAHPFCAYSKSTPLQSAQYETAEFTPASSIQARRRGCLVAPEPNILTIHGGH